MIFFIADLLTTTKKTIDIITSIAYIMSKWSTAGFDPASPAC